MLPLSSIRRGACPRDGKEKSAPPPVLRTGPGCSGRPFDHPFDRLPMSTLGRFLLAHWSPAVCNLPDGSRVLIWRELWDAHLYPWQYYAASAHVERN